MDAAPIPFTDDDELDDFCFAQLNTPGEKPTYRPRKKSEDEEIVELPHEQFSRPGRPSTNSERSKNDSTFHYVPMDMPYDFYQQPQYSMPWRDGPVPSTSRYKTDEKAPYDPFKPIIRNEKIDEMARKNREASERRYQKNNNTAKVNFSRKAIKNQVRKELEKQAANPKFSTKEKEEKNIESVLFKCPLISDEVLPRKKWHTKIKRFLYDQLETDLGMAACRIIHNFNKVDDVKVCVEIIKKYLENIMEHDLNEEKFHKIRTKNATFDSKVANVEGALIFLQACGFREKIIDDENYLIWSKDFPIEILIQLSEALETPEIFTLELDRNMKVLLPSQIQNVMQPQITSDEQDSLTLKTKAMREKEREGYANKFRYSLIQIRFPDGLYLQGMFQEFEKLLKVFEFIAENLYHEKAEFSLISPECVKFSTEDKEMTLRSLKLIPVVNLNFVYEGDSRNLREYLKEDLSICSRCNEKGHYEKNCKQPKVISIENNEVEIQCTKSTLSEPDQIIENQNIGKSKENEKIVRSRGNSVSIENIEISTQTDLSMSNANFKEFLMKFKIKHKKDEKVIVPSKFKEGNLKVIDTIEILDNETLEISDAEEENVDNILSEEQFKHVSSLNFNGLMSFLENECENDENLKELPRKIEGSTQESVKNGSGSSEITNGIKVPESEAGENSLGEENIKILKKDEISQEKAEENSLAQESKKEDESFQNEKRNLEINNDKENISDKKDSLNPTPNNATAEASSELLPKIEETKEHLKVDKMIEENTVDQVESPQIKRKRKNSEKLSDEESHEKKKCG